MTSTSKQSAMNTEQPFAIPKVKICGIMAPPDAQAAVAHGADFLGLNFVNGQTPLPDRWTKHGKSCNRLTLRARQP